MLSLLSVLLMVMTGIPSERVSETESLRFSPELVDFEDDCCKPRIFRFELVLLFFKRNSVAGLCSLTLILSSGKDSCCSVSVPSSCIVASSSELPDGNLVDLALLTNNKKRVLNVSCVYVIVLPRYFSWFDSLPKSVSREYCLIAPRSFLEEGSSPSSFFHFAKGVFANSPEPIDSPFFVLAIWNTLRLSSVRSMNSWA